MTSLISMYVYICTLKSGMQFTTCLFYHSTTFAFFSLILVLGWHFCLLKSHSIVTNQNQKISSPKWTAWTASVMNELLSVLPLIRVHKGQLSFEHLQICLLLPLVWFLSTLWLNFWVNNTNNCLMLIPALCSTVNFKVGKCPSTIGATVTQHINPYSCCVLSEIVGWMLALATKQHNTFVHLWSLCRMVLIREKSFIKSSVKHENAPPVRMIPTEIV